MFDLIFPDVIKMFCACPQCTRAQMTTPPRVLVPGPRIRVRANTCKLGVIATRVAILVTARIAQRFGVRANLGNSVNPAMIAGFTLLEDRLPNKLSHDECILDHRVLIHLARMYAALIPGRLNSSPAYQMDSETPRDFFRDRIDIAMIALLLPITASM